MPTLDEIKNALPPERQAKIRARSAELIAEIERDQRWDTGGLGRDLEHAVVADQEQHDHDPLR